MTPELTERTMKEIIEPTMRGMAEMGHPSRRVLRRPDDHRQGSELIEYNVRFGDPECQVLMMRMKSDLLPLLLAAARGELDRAQRRMARRNGADGGDGFQGLSRSYDKGTPIEALPENARICMSSTPHGAQGRTPRGDRGRVLNVTALGDSVSEAQSKAYRAIDDLRWEKRLLPPGHRLARCRPRTN